MIPRRPALLAGALLCLAARAGAGSEIINDAPRPHLAVPFARAAPLLTAQAGDPAWARAATAPLDAPSLGSPPPATAIPGTEVRALWSADALFVRFLCHDDKPPFLEPYVAGAPVFHDDAVEIFLDPAGDCRQWLELEVNPAGNRYAQMTLCTAEPKWDRALRLTSAFIARDVWTFPVPGMKGLRTAAAAWPGNGQGWIVDIAIPALALLQRTGLKKFQPMTLRANFLRYQHPAHAGAAKRDFLSLTWSPVPLGIPHRCPAAFGYLDLTPP